MNRLFWWFLSVIESLLRTPSRRTEPQQRLVLDSKLVHEIDLGGSQRASAATWGIVIDKTRYTLNGICVNHISLCSGSFVQRLAKATKAKCRGIERKRQTETRRGKWGGWGRDWMARGCLFGFIFSWGFTRSDHLRLAGPQSSNEVAKKKRFY